MDRQLDYELKFHTFGCKVNTYDTGLIQKNLSPQKSDSISTSNTIGNLSPQIHVLNTCAVTQEATKEAVKLIKKLKKNDPTCKVVVTGCGAQVDTDSFTESFVGSDLVVANSHKGLLPQIIDQHLRGENTERVFKSNIFKKEDLEIGGGIEDSHTRSFLKIQDGCNSFCTYCIIPFARGKSRSIPILQLVNRVNELHLQGIKEVVITGIHIADYEDDSQGEVKYLDDLIEALLKQTKMPRFRISSLEPKELTDRLLELYQDARLCPHFHLSIQSANDLVLEKMKRRYRQQEVMRILNRIEAKVKNAFIGMDVITGFNYESAQAFDETYKVLADHYWTKIHVFPYSERPGTFAMKLEEAIPLQERQYRAARLRELSLHRYQAMALRQLDSAFSLQKALIFNPMQKRSVADEKGHDPVFEGLTNYYWNVRIPFDSGTSHLSANTEVSVRLKKYIHPENRMDGYFEAECV